MNVERAMLEEKAIVKEVDMETKGFPCQRCGLPVRIGKVVHLSPRPPAPARAGKPVLWCYSCASKGGYW